MTTLYNISLQVYLGVFRSDLPIVGKEQNRFELEVGAPSADDQPRNAQDSAGSHALFKDVCVAIFFK